MIVDIFKESVGRLAQEVLTRLRDGVAARQDEEARQGGRDHDFAPVHFLFQDFGKADLGMDIKRFPQGAAAKIAVDQQGLGPGKSHGDSEVGGDGRLAFVRHGARDEQSLGPRAFIGHEEDGRADVAIRLGKDVPSIVGLEERDRAFRFLLRDLTENVLVKIVLELSEGRHPVVDPIKQDEDDKAGKGAEAKPDEQASDQTGAH